MEEIVFELDHKEIEKNEWLKNFMISGISYYAKNEIKSKAGYFLLTMMFIQWSYVLKIKNIYLINEFRCKIGLSETRNLNTG